MCSKRLVSKWGCRLIVCWSPLHAVLTEHAGLEQRDGSDFFQQEHSAGAGLASGLLPLTSTADSASLGRSKHGL